MNCAVVPNAWRLSQLKELCASDVTSWNRKLVRTRLIADHRRKLLFCTISKSGCTQTKGLMEYANTNNTKYLTNPNSVHSKEAYRRAKLEFVSRYSKKFDAYQKFLVVRNPFDRAVSAYKNLLVGRKNLGPEKFVYQELQRLFPNSSTNPVLMNNFSFAQFVSAISNSSLSRHRYFNDRHFLPMFQSCDPCRINYDYLLKLETFDRDVIQILALLDLSEDTLEHFPALNRARHKKSVRGYFKDQQDSWRQFPASKSVHKFQDLPKHLLKSFMRRYRTDFELFGFNFSVGSQVGHSFCKFEKENCC